MIDWGKNIKEVTPTSFTPIKVPTTTKQVGEMSANVQAIVAAGGWDYVCCWGD